MQFRKSTLFVFLGILCLVFFLNVVAAAEITPELRAALEQGSGEAPVIVVFEDDATAVQAVEAAVGRTEKIRALQKLAQASRESFMAQFGHRAKSLKTYWIVNAIATTANIADVESFATHPGVARVELDATVQLPKTEMSLDAEKGEWTYGLEKLQIPEVRENFGILGDGVLVGVIDTGVDATHPDLKDKVIGFKDCINSKTVAYDDQGHGTHCCGTIAGGNAGGTHIGVAPNAKLIVAKAFSASGTSQSSWLLSSMEFMADPDGDPATNDAPQVVSNSWGGSAGTTTYLDAVKTWVSLGIFPCFAAGNSGPGAGTVGTPGGYLESFAVGATSSTDAIASFSSRGPVTWDGTEHIKPDVSAPGKDVYSAKRGGGYTTMSGTSMACPHVSGVVALICCASPGISVEDVRVILEDTAKELGAEGKDNVFGAGRVNAFAALELAISGGRLVGTLKDAQSGEALSGIITVVERDINMPSDPVTGAFLTTLPEGDYTLRASAFGYRDGGPWTVTLVAGEETQHDIVLAKAAFGTVKGAVKAADSGALLEASVRVLDTPLAPFTTQSGVYDVQVPGGTYRLLIMAFGYALHTTEPIIVDENAQVELDIELQPLPPVLLVDDDKGLTYEKYYTAALDALGKAYDVVSIKESGALVLDDILGYESVLWFCGNDYGTSLTEQDQLILTKYLECGGRLLVSGQDVGYDINGSAFFSKVLKAKFLKDDVGVRAINGQGLSFNIEGGTGAGNQRYPDAIEALQGATVLYDYAGFGAAGLMVSDLPGKVIYLAFGVEGVDTADNRQAIIGKALATLEPSAVDRVARLALFDRCEHRLRWAELVAPWIDGLDGQELEQLHVRLGGRASEPAVRDLLRAIQTRLHQDR